MTISNSPILASNLNLQYANVMQQTFSSECSSILHLVILVLKMLYKAWSSHAKRSKYLCFATSLKAAAAKVDEYYEKTTQSPAYIMEIHKTSFIVG